MFINDYKMFSTKLLSTKTLVIIVFIPNTFTIIFKKYHDRKIIRLLYDTSIQLLI